MLILNILWAGATLFAGSELVRFAVAPEPERESEPEPEPELESASADAGETVVVIPTPEDDPFERAGQSLSLSTGALVLSLVGRAVPVARLLSLPLLVLGMVPIAREAWASFRTHRRVDYAGMTTLGTVLELGLGFTGLASLGWIVFTGGKRLQLLTRRQTERELGGAFDGLSETAWLLHDGIELQAPIADIGLDDRVIVRGGDPIPIDGTIVEGTVAVDQRALTGESRLVELGVGDEVLAATLVLSGTALVRPERTGSETIAARVEALLAETESYEQQLRDRAEREAERSVRPTLALMGLGLAGRGPSSALAGFWTNSTELSWFGAPYSVINTVQAAARASILIKDGRSLEQLAQVDTVVFDKTGTLTLDSFEVVRVHALGEHDEAELLGFAAALEQRQQHPIARAIVAAAEREGVEIVEPEQLSTAIGFGLRARVGARSTVIGSTRLMELDGIELPAVSAEIAGHAAERGHSLIYLAIDGRCVGLLELAPELRPEARQILDRLRDRGLELMMVTGDDEAPSLALAARLGIREVHARTLPEDKGAIIGRLQAEGRRVCFIGDGLNDGLALHRANVSISMVGASVVAVESAQILLQSGSLAQLDALFELAREFQRDQRVIVGLSRGVTVASGFAFLLLGVELSALVWLYAASFGVTLAAASLPKWRELPRPVEPARTLAAAAVH